jgi:membrane-bound lytic murein transglycosylase F
MRKKLFAKVVVPALFISAGVPTAIYSTKTVIEKHISECRMLEYEHSSQFSISPYDDIFKAVGAEYEIDWRLLASIARIESRFRFDAVSQAGAVGLMQIMPLVAHNMGYTREQLFDPRTNVEVAAKLLHENEKMLHLPANLGREEQLRFILACYNAGYSRIADAKRLAHYFDADGNKWNIVALFLSWLSDPEFSECEVVVSGAFYGSKETIEYVDKVLHTYAIYISDIRL